MTTATYVPILPVSTVGEVGRVVESANRSAVRGRRVVWSAGNGAGALRTKGRRRRLQQLSFVVAAVAAVAALASVVSTWSIIGAVGYDPATALWTVPVAEVGGRMTTNQSSAVSQWQPPEVRSAVPTESSSTPPGPQRATLRADSATGSNSVPASVASSRPSISAVDAKTLRVDDSGLGQAVAGAGQTAGGSGAGSAAGEGSGSDGEPDAGSAVGEDKGSDGEPDAGSVAGKGKGSGGEPDDSDTGSAPGAGKAQGWDRSSDRLDTEATKAGRGRMSECDSDRSDTELEAPESNVGPAVVPKSERCGDRQPTNP